MINKQTTIEGDDTQYYLVCDILRVFHIRCCALCIL